MSDLPAGWATGTLVEVCTLINGRAYGQSELLKAGKYPVLRVGNFFSNRGWYYSDLELDADKYCDKGDLLYAWSASFGPKIWRGEKVIFHYHIWKTDPDPRAVDKVFLYHWFEWDKKNIQLDHGTGSTMIHVTKGDMETRRLSFPPIAEQRRIVAKIDRLSARLKRARDALERVEILIIRYKNFVLEAAYNGHFADEASVEAAPLSQMIHSLDQGWSPKCEPNPAIPGSWAVMKTTAVQAIYFYGDENKALPPDLSPRPELEIKCGDIIITRAGPRSRVGIACLAERDYPGVMLCDKAYRLRVRPGSADPKYLTLMLNAPQCLRSLEDMKTGGNDSGLNLTQAKFLAIRLPAIPVKRQIEIVRRVEHAFAAIDRLAAEARSARALLDKLDQSILAKAFRGELVPQDPNDEPASVLLDRIRTERAAAPAKKRGRRVPTEA